MEQLATNPLVLRTATLSPIRELSKSASPRQGRLYQVLRRTDRTTAEAASGLRAHGHHDVRTAEASSGAQLKQPNEIALSMDDVLRLPTMIASAVVDYRRSAP